MATPSESSPIAQTTQRSLTDNFAIGRMASPTAKLVPFSRAASTPPERGLKGRSARDMTTSEPDVKWLRMSLSRKRSQYFDKAFASREPIHSVKSRAAKDAAIIAEVNISCCLEAEQEVLIDLAFLLSEIYQRPVACIVVLVKTDFSILLNGSCEPAYRFSITAVDTEISATRNKRTAALLRNYMFETTRISPNRGVLTFHTISEDGLVANDIDCEAEMDMTGKNNGIKDTRSRKMNSPQSSSRTSSSTTRFKLPRNSTAPTSQKKASSFLGGDNVVGTKHDGSQGSSDKVVKKRKSFMALLGF